MTMLRVVNMKFVRKTGNLLFLLEKARKAAKSALKHRKREILKQCPFSKAFSLKFFAECLSCLVKPVKASKSTGKLVLTVSKPGRRHGKINLNCTQKCSTIRRITIISYSAVKADAICLCLGPEIMVDGCIAFTVREICDPPPTVLRSQLSNIILRGYEDEQIRTPVQPHT